MGENKKCNNFGIFQSFTQVINCSSLWFVHVLQFHYWSVILHVVLNQFVFCMFVLVFNFPWCLDFINFYLFFLVLKFWMFKKWHSQGLVENLVNQGLFWYLINFDVLEIIEIDGGCGVFICNFFSRFWNLSIV